MILFTMCIDIGRFDNGHLMTAANAWVDSLFRSGTSVDRAIVFTNLPMERVSDERIDIRPVEADTLRAKGAEAWQELLYRKLTYGAGLAKEFGVNPVWLDLDSYVANDLSHLDDVDEFCTMLGSRESRPMQLVEGRPDLSVPRHDLINGSFFRLGDGFIASTLDTVERYRGRLTLGDQDALNLVYHFEGRHVPVLGRDVARDSLFSFEAWNDDLAEHIDMENSRNLVWGDDGKLRSRLHPGKTVDLVQFTFRRFIQLLSEEPTESNEFIERWKQSGRTERLSLR